MVWTADQLNDLLSQRPIVDRFPWNAGSAAVERFYRSACAEIERKTRWASRVEWGHYGSGYASYVDAWFYDGRKSQGGDGLAVLLSRLSPYFLLQQGQKTWHATGGGSYLPSPEQADHFADAAVRQLAYPVQQILEGHGLVRLFGRELREPLPDSADVPTILSDPPFCQWDALFYWED